MAVSVQRMVEAPQTHKENRWKRSRGQDKPDVTFEHHNESR